jgi:hypothetical protein
MLTLDLHWDNPAVGVNSYDASVTPVGQADGTGFSVGFFGATRGNKEDTAEVTFVLLSGKCAVNVNTGEIVRFGEDRYAAIWEKRDGPPFVACHRLNAAQYQQTFDELSGQGFRLIQVSGYCTNV